jgi:hypothetical protein
MQLASESLSGADASQVLEMVRYTTFTDVGRLFERDV